GVGLSGILVIGGLLSGANGSVAFGPGPTGGETGGTGVDGTGSVFIGTFGLSAIGGRTTSWPAPEAGGASGEISGIGGGAGGLDGGATGVGFKSIAGGGIVSGFVGAAGTTGLVGAGAGGVSRSINGGGNFDLSAFGAGPTGGTALPLPEA